MPQKGVLLNEPGHKVWYFKTFSPHDILLNFQVSILKIYFISTQSLWEKTQEDIFRLKRSLWMAPYLRLSVNQIVFGKCAKNDCQKGIQ